MSGYKIQYYLLADQAAPELKINVFDFPGVSLLGMDKKLSGLYSELIDFYRTKYDRRFEGVGNLFSTDNSQKILVYSRTDYYWHVLSNHYENGKIEAEGFRYLHRETHPDKSLDGLVDLMRISSVGIGLRTKDENFVLHVRSQNLPVAPGMIDCPAGIVYVMRDEKGGFYMNFKETVYAKLGRELNLDKDEMAEAVTLNFTGLHNSTGSGMQTFYATIEKESGEITMDEEKVGKLIMVPAENLADFIIDHIVTGNIVGDSAATLLRCLPEGEFRQVIDYLNRNNLADINYGKLESCKFIPQPWPIVA